MRMLLDADGDSVSVQRISKLCFAVLVAQCTIESEVKGNQWPPEQVVALQSCQWWLLLETTRVLLGHPSLGDSRMLHETILGNLHALLRIAHIDMTTLAEDWDFLGDLKIWYKPLDKHRGSEPCSFCGHQKKGSVLWLSQQDPSKLLSELVPTSYEEVLASFQMPLGTEGPHQHALLRCRSIFGNAVFRLHATTKAFRAAADEFRILRV